MSRNQMPEINAGSMADIAFLLLIFFLVTTTMDIDIGILRKIPKKEDRVTSITIKDKNFLEINLNKNNELFIEDKVIDISELKELTLKFLDNGGGTDKNGQPCNWCNGDKNSKLSDHPTKAVIAIKADRDTNYETYINVLDNVNSAYATLRDRLSVKLYQKTFSALQEDYKKSTKDRERILLKIKNIKEKYPLLLSDLETDQNMAKR